MKAVVMAGGEGSRLRPLTAQLLKPLLPVAGRPVMEHIVNNLRRHGITEIVTTVCYLADMIEAYFGDGTAFGVQMQFVREELPLGTAGAVKQAHDFLQDDAFLIISGDALTDIDLTALIADHYKHRVDATIALTHVAQALSFGIALTDDENHITRFLEKPSWGSIQHFIGNQDHSSEPVKCLSIHESARLGGHGFRKSAVFADTINTGIYADGNTNIHRTAYLKGPIVLEAHATISTSAVRGPAFTANA